MDTHRQTHVHTHAAHTLSTPCYCWQIYYNEHSLVVPYNVSMAIDNHFELIDLEPSTAYLVNITAENAKGEGPPSDPILLQTTADSPGRHHATQCVESRLLSVRLDPLSPNRLEQGMLPASLLKRTM